MLSPMRLTAFLLALLLVGCDRDAQSQQSPAPQSVEVPTGDGATPLEILGDEVAVSRRTAITRAVEAASPAVVSINVIEVQQVRVRDPLARFFGMRVPDQVYQQQIQGLGSGFVISPDGYIVTNDHVAGNATEITVAFPDGSTLDAELVGSDPETDIALVKVDPPEPLPYLAFEEREEAIVGEWAVALGNPFGLFEAAEPTVTVGVVSGVGRDFPTQEGRVFRDMIQTDAAINSGNSGGPLINALGRVMGMNTFIFSRSGGSVGIGFAVPAWRVKSVVAELRETGQVDRSFYTGLSLRAVDARIARALGLNEARGLIVASVDADSPAERAGLQPYDIIVRLGNEEVASVADIRARLVDSRAGDTVTLGIVRDGEEQDVPLTLGTAG